MQKTIPRVNSSIPIKAIRGIHPANGADTLKPLDTDNYHDSFISPLRPHNTGATGYKQIKFDTIVVINSGGGGGTLHSSGQKIHQSHLI